MGSTLHQPKSSNEDEDCMHAMQLAASFMVPTALTAAIELDVLEIIAGAGPAAQLSPSQIAAHFPMPAPDAATTLDRILRLLASHSILTCTVHTGNDGSIERSYGLTPMCKFFVRNHDGVSLAPLVLLNKDRVFTESCYHLKDAVLEGAIPFDQAHGMSAFEYNGKDARFSKVFNRAMSDTSVIVTKKILENYKGFEGLREIVDVGGGVGATLNMIIARYPHLKGINFDLPHVVTVAPEYSGVEHAGGDMFFSIPTGEAIFMKVVLHGWSDEHCLKILKNCYSSLPDDGIVIVVDVIIPNAPETNIYANCAFLLDVQTLAYNQGGKERTKEEFEALAKGAGFACIRVVCNAYHFSIMEFYKKM